MVSARRRAHRGPRRGPASGRRRGNRIPDAIDLWQAAETVAREVGQGEVVSRAYHRALVESPVDAVLAETLVQRMIAFEGEYGAASPLLVEALQRLLELSPGARWAIDRVKLVLGSQARWDELFRIYDRAIAAAVDARAHADLLDEAAFAAKDLAASPERAIVYLESIHELRPEDPAVDAALERLYEKQGQTSALIQLLGGRLDRCTGFHHRELLRRSASLWTDLGSGEEAIAIVDRLLSDGAAVADMTNLLERLAADRGAAGGAEAADDGAADPSPAAVAQTRAIAVLRAHYEAAGQVDDVVRMAERELALARDAEARARSVRDLVALRLAAAERSSPTASSRRSSARSRPTWPAMCPWRRSRSKRCSSERSARGSSPPDRAETTRRTGRGASSTSSRSSSWRAGRAKPR